LPLILNIETATDVCSVALAKDGELVAVAETKEPRAHASQLTLLIQKVFTESGFGFSETDALAVSKGPGSYTGLRIGAATAKGLCYALNKPLIAINSLQVMAANFVQKSKINPDQSEGNSKLIPLIDARRMEVYSAVFDIELNFIEETKAEIINEFSFSELLKSNRVYFFGDGVNKCLSFLKNNKNAVCIENFSTSAGGMIHLSEMAFGKKVFEDLAYFEPYYLKEFVAVQRKN